MTALRPLVLVYQELAAATSTPNAPDLNTIVVGPAYYLQDYATDKQAITLGSFGAFVAHNDAAGIPVGLINSSNVALSASNAPSNIVGGVVDFDSVKIYLDNAYMDIVHGTGAGFGAAIPDKNLVTVAGATFAASGVRPGDRLVVTDYTTTPSVPKSLSFVVYEVGGYANSSLLATQLRTRQELSTGAGVDIQDQAYSAFVNSGLVYRIERRVSDALVVDPVVTRTGVGNAFTVNGGLQIEADVDNDGVDELRDINSATLFFEYRSLRTDLALLTDVSGPAVVSSLVGRFDERNPAAVGLTIALANTTTNVYFYGVTGDDLNGTSTRQTAYLSAFDQIRSYNDLYAIVPLASEPGILAALSAHTTGMADPEKAKFRVGIGALDEMPTTKVIGSAGIDGNSSSVSGDAVDVLVHAAGQFSADGVLPGDKLRILADVNGVSRDGVYTISQVFDDARLQTTSAIPAAAAGNGLYYVLRGTGSINRQYIGGSVTVAVGDEITLPAASAADVGRVIRLIGGADAGDYLIVVNAGAGVVEVLPATLSGAAATTVQILDPISSIAAAASIVSRAAYRRISSASAQFVSDGAVASDYLQVPIPAAVSSADFTDVYSAQIETVQSNNTLDLVLGSDIPTTDPAAVQNTIGYRVLRQLDRDGQVDELVSIATSYSNRRHVMIPNAECLVSGLTDARTGLQSRQPGYYLACVVGGMSAGLPPQQGFTYIGVAGIDQVFYSTGYFSDEQLTEISGAGWYVFLQDSAQSLPYSMHQLTTDTSSLEEGELSFRRCYDYDALAFKAAMIPFIGRWNIVPGIEKYLQASLDAAAANLISDARPRIGPPLLSAEITAIRPFAGTRDRIEVYMELDIPRVLNRIGLRLIA